MEEEEIKLTEATEYFVPFPEPETIFKVDLTLHREHFIPLCTLNLNYFNSDWVGTCPLVSTVEPCGEGLFGDKSKGSGSYYCRENWIGYQLSDNKLRYSGDWNLFKRNENHSYYKSVFEGYGRAKAHFEKFGHLSPYRYRDTDETWQTKERAVELAWIGGESIEGNWASTTDFPVKITDGEAFPLTEDGRPFDYLCSVEVGSFVYGENQAEWFDTTMLVFFDAEKQILLTTFEWT